MQRETQLLNAAVQQMKRMLTNVYVYYPIHVGMLANIEDALVYRASLAPLYQPMNQRSYLSRNVQSCGDAS